MVTEALIVLANIDRGLPVDDRLLARWRKALTTIQWLSETNDTLTLTAAGQTALRRVTVPNRYRENAMTRHAD
jgi:hypothetical protein